MNESLKDNALPTTLVAFVCEFYVSFGGYRVNHEYLLATVDAIQHMSKDHYLLSVNRGPHRWLRSKREFKKLKGALHDVKRYDDERFILFHQKFVTSGRTISMHHINGTQEWKKSIEVDNVAFIDHYMYYYDKGWWKQVDIAPNATFTETLLIRYEGPEVECNGIVTLNNYIFAEMSDRHKTQLRMYEVNDMRMTFRIPQMMSFFSLRTLKTLCFCTANHRVFDPKTMQSQRFEGLPPGCSIHALDDDMALATYKNSVSLIDCRSMKILWTRNEDVCYKGFSQMHNGCVLAFHESDVYELR